jgi:hypothetical protein
LQATIDATTNLNLHKEAVVKLTAKEKALQATFAQLLLEAPKFEKYLTKVFKKKIKRSKKVEETEDNEDDDDDDDEEDMSSDDEIDEEEDEEFDDTQCPSGLDQSVFDRVSKHDIH